MDTIKSNLSDIYRKRVSLSFPNLLLGLSLVLCLLIGKFSQFEAVLSLALCIILCLTFKYDEFYIYIGIFIFFVDEFNINLENPVYRIYTYLLLIKLLLQIRNIKLKAYWFPSLIAFAAFSIFSVGLKLSFRNGFNLLADILVVYFIIIKLYSDTKLLRKFFMVFVLTAICAGIYSILADNKLVYDIGRMNIRSEEIVRYCATYGDANYAGFFYNAAIFTALCQKDFRILLRIPVLLVLHYFLLLTDSITALLCYIICMTCYIILRYRKKSPVVFGIIAASMIALICAVVAIPALNQIKFINNIIIRVTEQLRYFKSGRMDMFTSDRNLIWEYFIHYFKNQNFLGKLFGGNVITSMYTEKIFETYKACHLAYLQGLLNFGVVGSFAVFISKFVRYIVGFLSNIMGKYKKEDSDIYRAITIISTAWIFFAFSIDYFLDWRFMLFYFI